MKTAVCIFAHPDDESFGPGGTVHLLTKTHDVYLICVTNGDAGKNSLPNSTEPLGETRQRELKKSSSLLGTKKVYFLNFEDASLNNLQYHDIVNKIKPILEELKPELLMTFEPQGVSGHLDHVAVSMITSYLFENTPSVKKIMYFCLSQDQALKFGPYFVYRPEGYALEDIDETVDISTAREIKTKAMFLHKSQLHDAKKLLALFGSFTKEYFLIREKE